MPINTDCPSCNRKLRVPDELLGKKVKCPTCGTVFPADESSTPEPAAPAAAEEPLAPAPVEDRLPQEEGRDSEEDEEGALGPPRSGRSGGSKPERVQTIGVMMLISGILGVLLFLGLGGGT